MKTIFKKPAITILLFFITISALSQTIIDSYPYDSHFSIIFNQSKNCFINSKNKFELKNTSKHRFYKTYKYSYSNKYYQDFPNTVLVNFELDDKRRQILKDLDILSQDILTKKLNENYKLKKGRFTNIPTNFKKITSFLQRKILPESKDPFYIFYHKEDTELSKNLHPIVLLTFEKLVETDLDGKKIKSESPYIARMYFISSSIKLKELESEENNIITQNKKRITDLENSYSENPLNYETTFFEALYKVCDKGAKNDFSIFKGEPIKYLKFDWEYGENYESNFSWPFATNTIFNELKGDMIVDSQSFNVVFDKLSKATQNIFKKYAHSFVTTHKEGIIKLNNSKEISIVEAKFDNYGYMLVKINNRYFRIYTNHFKESENLYISIEYVKNYLEKQQKQKEVDKRYAKRELRRQEIQAKIDKENTVIEAGKLISKRDIESFIKGLKETLKGEFQFSSSHATKNKFSVPFRDEYNKSLQNIAFIIFIPKKTINKVSFSNNQYPTVDIGYYINGDKGASITKNISSIEDEYDYDEYMSFSVQKFNIIYPKNTDVTVYFDNVKDCHILFLEEIVK